MFIEDLKTLEKEDILNILNSEKSIRLIFNKKPDNSPLAQHIPNSGALL